MYLRAFWSETDLRSDLGCAGEVALAVDATAPERQDVKRYDVVMPALEASRDLLDVCYSDSAHVRSFKVGEVRRARLVLQASFAPSVTDDRAGIHGSVQRALYTLKHCTKRVTPWGTVLDPWDFHCRVRCADFLLRSRSRCRCSSA